MATQYNTKCAGVKRLMKEAMELKEPTEMFHAQPLEENLFEWHFTIRGTMDTDFDGGIYHGRILFPPDYPMKPPNMILLTPNGRFELNKKICLSISGYHPETWLPSWSIRTALLALIGFLPSPAAGALGSLEYPPKERKRLAKLSPEWKCSHCQVAMKDVLKPISDDGKSKTDSEEAKELASKLKFQDEATVKKEIAAQNSAQSIEVAEPTPQAEVTTETSQIEEVAENTANSDESVPNAEPVISAPPPPQVVHAPLRRAQNAESFDFSMLITVPIYFVCFSVFVILLSRRMLLPSPSEDKEL